MEEKRGGVQREEERSREGDGEKGIEEPRESGGGRDEGEGDGQKMNRRKALGKRESRGGGARRDGGEEGETATPSELTSRKKS